MTLQNPDADSVAPAGPPCVTDYANVSNAAPGVWRETTLGNFVSLRRGHDLTEVARRPGTVPVFGSAGPNGFHDTALVKGPGVVVGRSGASFGQAHYSGRDYWPHNTVLYVTDFHGNDRLFCYYFLRSIDFSRHNSGGAQQSLNRNFISSIPIRVPEPDEQRVIATAFADVDQLLAALEALIAKKQAIKTAVMQRLVTGKRRLPGFSGGWEVRRLGELGAFSKGKGIRRDEVVSEGFPCVRYGEIYTRHNDYIRTFHSFITPAVARMSQRIRSGDLLFSGSGETAEEIGKCVAFLGEEEAYAGGDIVIFSPVGQDSMVLGYLMNHSSIVAQKARMGQGDAVVHISARNLAQLEFPLPEPVEQQAIAAVLSDMDAEIDALKARRDKTVAIKQGIMQELLTGRARLI